MFTLMYYNSQGKVMFPCWNMLEHVMQLEIKYC